MSRPMLNCFQTAWNDVLARYNREILRPVSASRVIWPLNTCTAHCQHPKSRLKMTTLLTSTIQAVKTSIGNGPWEALSSAMSWHNRGIDLPVYEYYGLPSRLPESGTSDMSLCLYWVVFVAAAGVRRTPTAWVTQWPWNSYLLLISGSLCRSFPMGSVATDAVQNNNWDWPSPRLAAFTETKNEACLSTSNGNELWANYPSGPTWHYHPFQAID